MFRAVAPLIRSSCEIPTYPVLVSVSRNYPGHMGRLPTCYSPVRHWLPKKASFSLPSVRLACIRHAASVHPEPGSNSPFDLALSDVLWHRFLFYRNWRFLFLSGLFLFSFQRSRSALSAPCSVILPNPPPPVNIFFYFFYLFLFLFVLHTFVIGFIDSLWLETDIFVDILHTILLHLWI